MRTELSDRIHPDWIIPEVLPKEFCKPVLPSVRPKTFIGVTVINWICSRIMQGAEFGGERILSIEVGAISYEIDSVEGPLIEKRVDIEARDMAGQRFDVLVIHASAVELIQHESLQHDFRGIRIPWKA